MSIRYANTQQGTRYDGKRVYLTTYYPEIPVLPTDIYITSQQGQRLDSLSLQYYKDSQYWWIIALANNLGKGSLSVIPGAQLRIPTNLQIILSDFKTLNMD